MTDAAWIAPLIWSDEMRKKLEEHSLCGLGEAQAAPLRAHIRVALARLDELEIHLVPTLSLEKAILEKRIEELTSILDQIGKEEPAVLGKWGQKYVRSLALKPDE